jgi:hypothetical protein
MPSPPSQPDRREGPWPADEPRQRRRPRWGEFRGAYPRIVTALALGLVLVLALDGWLLVKRLRYARQVKEARETMSTAERQRADAIVAAAEGRTRLQLALVRRDARLEDDLSLAVSLDSGRLSLQSEGAQLRDVPIRVGATKEVGEAPHTVRLVPPRGRFTVARVVDGSHRWRAPDWLFADRGVSRPDSLEIQGGLGPVAILLSGGGVIYSDPASGPLQDPDYVLPGAVRASAADLRAIADALEVGMPVYFF